MKTSLAYIWISRGQRDGTLANGSCPHTADWVWSPAPPVVPTAQPGVIPEDRASRVSPKHSWV